MGTTTVRTGATADLTAIQSAWRAFAAEHPPSAHRVVDLTTELAEIAEIVTSGIAFVAEDDGRLVGFALARTTPATVVRLTDLYVVPEARRQGVATALIRAVLAACGDRGMETVDLEVGAANSAARAAYHRFGFRDESVVMSASLERLREQLEPAATVSLASLHVQTDDRGWVERTAAQYAPRIGSRGSRVEGPRNGWTTIYDPVVDADPTALLRYAREVSDRMGAVVVALSLELGQVVRLIALDRGGIVDEYLSVPEFYGPLPPGDVIGLAANATVLHRLTGADPAAVKAVARTGATPADLPPARELLAAIAAALGLEGATYGFAGP
jgi:ribosomal protein S18 acetylase RimI-like enzyme